LRRFWPFWLSLRSMRSEKQFAVNSRASPPIQLEDDAAVDGAAIGRNQNERMV
jgi:hypothetical protein